MTQLAGRTGVLGSERRSPVLRGVPGRLRGMPFNPLGVIAVVVGLVMWEVLAREADNFLFPTFLAVMDELRVAVSDGSLFEALRITFIKGLYGLLIGVGAGVVLGRIMAASKLVNDSLAPLVSAAFPVPRLAMYPLLVIALGAGGEAAIVLIAIEAFFPMLYSVQIGAASVTQRYRWLMSNVGASLLQREAVVLRAMTPSVVAGLRNAVPTALVVVVVTELIMGSSGVGFLVRDAGSQFQPARALAIVAALGVVGVVLNVAVKKLAELTQSWSLSIQS